MADTAIFDVDGVRLPVQRVPADGGPSADARVERQGVSIDDGLGGRWQRRTAERP